jgi:predicted metalloprotease with PDZ domain
MDELFEGIAHEFFHTWNLLSIQPEGYTDLNYGPQEASPGLWFSEGFTMLYAYRLMRRAGLPTEDSSWSAHLARLITTYYRDTGNRVFSPAKVSLASNAQPGPLGDCSASTHLQGELIGTLLDQLIVHCSQGKRSLDDLMRLMNDRFGGGKGFSDKDVETAAGELCVPGDIHPFFEKYVYEGKPLDFNPYLQWAGLNFQVTYGPATDDKGIALPDKRVYLYKLPGDSLFRLGLENPTSCWVRSGLHTGDVLISLDGRFIRTRQDFSRIISNLQIGDVISLRVSQGGEIKSAVVRIEGYIVPTARLTPIPPSGSPQGLPSPPGSLAR